MLRKKQIHEREEQIHDTTENQTKQKKTQDSLSTGTNSRERESSRAKSNYKPGTQVFREPKTEKKK